MRVKYLTIGFACLSFLGLGLVPAQVSAQLFRGSSFRRSAANRQPTCCPAQPAQAATSWQAVADSNPSNASNAMTPSPTSQANQAQQQERGRTDPARKNPQGRVVRGSQLVGLTIRGSDDQQLGVVKDFIVDSQGECPTIYLAVEPDASMQVDQEFVLIPYNALQYRSDNQGGTNYFALDVIGNDLRRAPRVTVNDWPSFDDRQVLGNVDQFYKRTEWTTARPIQGGSQQDNGQETRPEFGTRPDASTDGDFTPKPEIVLPLDNETRAGTAPQSESPADPDTATRPESGRAPTAGTRTDSQTRETVDQAVRRR